MKTIIIDGVEYNLTPKVAFREGDWVVYNDDVCQIVKREEGCNKLVTNFGIEKELVNERNLSTARPWTIQDAKDGDVLANRYGSVFIYAGFEDGERITVDNYCYITANHDEFCIEDHKTGSWYYVKDLNPATKEQRDLLFQKMKEAGYEWDAEKKKLKKIEEEVNGEDYGIDGLYHAQRILEKTLGSVDGYQSDDGILDHKAAITAVKKLYERKPAWSEEDEQYLLVCKNALAKYQTTDKWDAGIISHWLEDRLKLFKERYTWKPSDEQMKAFYKYVTAGEKNLTVGEDVLLQHLYNDLKKLKG